jgi:ribosomal protein S18 acetylase RimI-like enzyme
MSSISIRSCQRGDEVALALVGQASFLEAFAGVLSGSDILGHCARQHSVEKYAAYLTDQATAVWLAETSPGGAPVGYLVLTTPDLPLADLGATDVEVKRVYLLHRFQGGGLGRRLMQTAREHAVQAGKKRLLLGVYGDNRAAIGFYKSLGFIQLGTRQFRVGENLYDDLVLGLTL